jgi:hypothetical protein
VKIEKLLKRLNPGKQRRREMFVALSLFAILSGYLMSLLGVGLMTMGFHNLDTGHNAMWVEMKFKTNILDHGIQLDGQPAVMGPIQMYTTGMFQMFTAFALTIFSVLLFSAGLWPVIDMAVGKHDRN